MNMEMRKAFDGMNNYVGNATTPLNFENVQSLKLARQLIRKKCHDESKEYFAWRIGQGLCRHDEVLINDWTVHEGGLRNDENDK